MCYTISKKLLGKGGFGSVFYGKDQNNRPYAIKCCDIKKDVGIDNLLEPIIMSSISHPYLNNAKRIYVSEDKLYIVQEIAKYDLAHYTRKHKHNYKPSTDILKYWSYCLVKAISALHNNNIIHADIKASNVLLYDNDIIKLADFSLSLIKIDNKKFKHKICTDTHRPLEVLMEKEWDEAVDVWALGCTLYEIAYGRLLFQCQEEKDKKQRYINSILEWDKINNNKNSNSKSNSIIKIIKEIDMYPIEYNSPFLSAEMSDLSKIIFNDLINKILVVDQNKRPKINDLLNHSFFMHRGKVTYSIIRCDKNIVSEYEWEITMNYIKKLSEDREVVNLANKIYNSVNILSKYTQELKSTACVWIANKLIHRSLIEIQNDILPIILEIERDICHNIMFHIDCF